MSEKPLLEDLADTFEEVVAEQMKEADDEGNNDKDETGNKDETQNKDESGADDKDQSSDAWLKEFVGKLPTEIQTAVAGLSGEARETFDRWAKEENDRIAASAERDAQLAAVQADLEKYNAIFDPARESMEEAGMTGPQITASLFAWQRRIEADPARGLKELAATYGVDLTPGDTKGKTSDDDKSDDDDSEVGRLQARLDKLEAERQAETKAAEKRAADDVDKELAEFADAKDADGQPKYPHFADKQVQSTMAALMSSGVAADLEAAYTSAVMTIPKLRDQVLKAEADKAAAEAEAKRKAEAREAAKKAEKAKGGTGASDEDAATRDRKDEDETSLEDDLAAVLRAQQAA